MAYFKYNDKNIFYEEYGSKENILVLLHGNTASSNMFNDVIDYYINDFKILVIDFLGCGKSDRIEELNTDLWYDEALQVIQLLEFKNYENVNILGTSGGAIVAINVALERPDLVRCVIADSFEGEKSLDVITENIIKDRKKSMKDENAKAFYYLMNGEDWEKVVDADTNAIYEHSKKIKNFYHKDLSELSIPILFTGSKEDEFLTVIGASFYEKLFNDLINKVKDGRMYLFEHGRHPSMLSNKEEFAKQAKDFIGGI